MGCSRMSDARASRKWQELLDAGGEGGSALAQLSSTDRQHLGDAVIAQYRLREQAVAGALQQSADLLPRPLRRLVIRRFFNR